MKRRFIIIALLAALACALLAIVALVAGVVVVGVLTIRKGTSGDGGNGGVNKVREVFLDLRKGPVVPADLGWVPSGPMDYVFYIDEPVRFHVVTPAGRSYTFAGEFAQFRLDRETGTIPGFSVYMPSEPLDTAAARAYWIARRWGVDDQENIEKLYWWTHRQAKEVATGRFDQYLPPRVDLINEVGALDVSVQDTYDALNPDHVGVAVGLRFFFADRVTVEGDTISASDPDPALHPLPPWPSRREQGLAALEAGGIDPDSREGRAMMTALEVCTDWNDNELSLLESLNYVDDGGDAAIVRATVFYGKDRNRSRQSPEVQGIGGVFRNGEFVPLVLKGAYSNARPEFRDEWLRVMFEHIDAVVRGDAAEFGQRHPRYAGVKFLRDNLDGLEAGDADATGP